MSNLWQRLMHEMLMKQVQEFEKILWERQRGMDADFVADEYAERVPLWRTKMQRPAMQGAVLHDCVEHDGIFYVMGRNESDIPGCEMRRSVA